METLPDCTACFEFLAEEIGHGSSLSSPAAEAFTVLWVPPQSETTKPGKPPLFL